MQNQTVFTSRVMHNAHDALRESGGNITALRAGRISAGKQERRLRRMQERAEAKAYRKQLQAYRKQGGGVH